MRSVDAGDVNAYVKEADGDDYTAKDFPTWNATVIAASALARAKLPASEHEAARRVSDAIRCAAAALGNAPAVCRRSYVHPDVLDCAQAAVMAKRKQRRLTGLSNDELLAVALLDAASGEAKRRTLTGDLSAGLRARSRGSHAVRAATRPPAV